MRLTEIKGGSLNAKKLKTHLINQIASIEPVKQNTFESVPNHLELLAKNHDADTPTALPPRFFKFCRVEDVSPNKIKLSAEDWPVHINGDGCSTNMSASRKLSEEAGLLSRNTSCVGHAADGSIKWMVSSKTMNVPAISEFLLYF